MRDQKFDYQKGSKIDSPLSSFWQVSEGYAARLQKVIIVHLAEYRCHIKCRSSSSEEPLSWNSSHNAGGMEKARTGGVLYSKLQWLISGFFDMVETLVRCDGI